MKELRNILRGDYPDPSVLRVGNDYYLVASTFYYCPALTIWHSTDLKKWEPIANAVEGYAGDVEAPDLVYYKNRFYIYYPAYGTHTNYVVYADCITGPWSQPIDLKIPRIDPGHCVGEDGKRYLFMSQGYRVLLNDDGLSVAGPLEKVYDGWEFPEDWSVESRLGLEGSKIFKRGDYFYLISAEGGTAGPSTSHMEIAARSKSIHGPWENSPYNPIVHTYSSAEKWWSKGHGTVFDTPEGDWYFIYHGYENGYATLGRQTLISKIVWTEDDWFHAVEIDNFEEEDKENTTFLELSDSFKTGKLGRNWRWYKDYEPARCTFLEDGMLFAGKGNKISETTPLVVSAFSHSYEVTVKVEVKDSESVQGGLILYYNPEAFCFIGVDKEYLYSGRMAISRKQPITLKNNAIHLKIRNIDNIVTMYYSTDEKEWIMLNPAQNVGGFNHYTFGYFLSLRPGVYSIGPGSAKFSDFKYTHLE